MQCVNCGNVLKCVCGFPVQPIGQTVLHCPKLAKGRLWIHVTDDDGANVPDVPVEGTSKQSTDNSGMAKYEDLDPGPYLAAMTPSAANLKVYDVEKKTPLDRQVSVKAGVLAYVQYMLIRKATLQVRVVVKSGKNLAKESPLEGREVPLKVVYTGTGAQPAADDWTWKSDKADQAVSAGQYTLTPTLSGLSTADYEYSEAPKDVELQPGDTKPVVFEVVKKAELKTKFVLKAFGSAFLNNLPFTTTAIPVAVAPKATGTTGSTDTVGDEAVLKVTPGSYTVTPNFTVLDPASFEWKNSQTEDVDITGEDDKPVVFEIGRKAKLRVEIVYKHDHPYRLRDTEDGSVDIKLKFLGNEFNPNPVVLSPVKTKDGIAAFESLSPGQYEITPDFDQLAECKFDWTAETRTVSVFPGVHDPVIFEVEPLYQKVQFIAHCLATIPTQIYTGSDEDQNERINTKDLDGTAVFASFKKWKDKMGKWNKGDIGLDNTKAELLFKNCWMLEMQPQPPNAYYTSADLDPGEFGKLIVGNQVSEVPPVWEVRKKPTVAKFTDINLDASKATLSEKKGHLLKMKSKGVNDYWTTGDLDPLETAKLAIGNQIAVVPPIYDVQMADKFVEKEYTLDQCSEQSFRGKYHGLPEDREDIDARVSFIKDTLDKALAKLNDQEKHPTVLKVFLIPECFFQGLHGVYLETDKDYLVQSLERTVENAMWKDWVFGFGTINTVQTAPPVDDIVFTRTIYEMTNSAPLIRGGQGTGRGTTRLIPKLTNSAELADDLIEDPNKKRTQAINADVQFKAIESEIKAGEFLAQLLREEKTDGSPGQLFVTQGLPEALWKDVTATGKVGLLEELKGFLSRWGMARVIREIRNSRNDTVEKENPALDLWSFSAYASRARDAETSLPTLDQAVMLLIQAKWAKLFPAVPLGEAAWGDGSGNRQTVLTDLSTNLVDFSKECGFLLTHQHVAMQVPIDRMKNNDLLATQFEPWFIPDVRSAQVFKPSIFPLWRKLLEIYKTAKTSTVKLGFKKEELNLEDYCVVGPRKVGPWIDTVSAGRTVLPACKRMVFGVEICADHADGRLNAINTGGNAIDIDIQIVPSAGMDPKNFATKTGGYIFNCDGWSQQPKKGGKCIPTNFEGPNPFAFKDGAGRLVTLSPATPHSIVAKCESGKGTHVSETGTCLSPEDSREETPSQDLSNDIFGYGPGKLHFYALQTLPQ